MSSNFIFNLMALCTRRSRKSWRIAFLLFPISIFYLLLILFSSQPLDLPEEKHIVETNQLEHHNAVSIVPVAFPSQQNIHVPSCTHHHDPSVELLPAAPPYFFPLNAKVRKKSLQCHRDNNGTMKPTNDCCRPLFFWGGGKAGSTTLAMLLKHNPHALDFYDPNSGFVDGPKEVCWAHMSDDPGKFFTRFAGCKSCNSEEERGRVALDACPRYTATLSAERIACAFPSAKFLMLLRDPVVRSISEVNDANIRFGGKQSVGKNLIGQVKPLSNYYDMLTNLLQVIPPENVLVIQTDALNNDTQGIVDVVHDFIGLPRRNVTTVRANANSIHSSEKYQYPNREELETIIGKYCKGLEDFWKLVGYRFDDWMTNINHPFASKYYR